MPPHYIEIGTDIAASKVHEGINGRRSVASASSAGMKACAYIRTTLREHSIAGAVDLRKGAPMPPSAISQSKAEFLKRQRSKGQRWQPNPEEVSHMFTGAYGPSSILYRFVVISGDTLLSLGPNLGTFLGQVVHRSVEDGCKCLELVVLQKKGAHGSEVPRAVQELLMWSQAQTALVPCITSLASEVLIAERVLHTALYFSQGRDGKVRGEVGTANKGAKGDDLDIGALYLKFLQEIPQVSGRRAHTIRTAFPTLTALLAAVDADDGTLERKLGALQDVDAAAGAPRILGLGVVGAIKGALTAEYVPDSRDSVLMAARRALHEALGLQGVGAMEDDDDGGSGSEGDSQDDEVIVVGGVGGRNREPTVSRSASPQPPQAPADRGVPDDDSFEGFGLTPLGKKRPRASQ